MKRVVRPVLLLGPVPLLRVGLLGLLGLLTPACGLFAAGASGAAAPSPAAASAVAAPHSEDKAPGEQRKVGDFSVHRFSGSYFMDCMSVCRLCRLSRGEILIKVAMITLHCSSRLK